MRAPSTAGVVLTLLGLALIVGCSAPEFDPTDPGSVALQLFTLSDTEPGPQELDLLFDPDELANHVVPLLDALDGIAGSAAPRLLGVETAAGTYEAFVDLELALPGEGRAVYNLKLRQFGQEGWRIAWFQGPGVEWPPRNRRGASLTTSAPPEPPTDGW